MSIIRNYHKLKITTQYFEAVSELKKTFEIRLNDRDYKAGDVLVLREFNESYGLAGNQIGFTGREIAFITNYVLYDFEGLAPNYVAMSLSTMTAPDRDLIF